MNLKDLQREVGEWSRRNFGTSKSPALTALGLGEELGEFADAMVPMQSAIGRLMHSVLKAEQGIRGTPEEHYARASDAVGDLLVFLANLCDRVGIDMDEAATRTWAEVSQRDWVRFPKNGRTE